MNANISFLTADATAAQIVKNATVISSKQTAKKAEKTALNHSIIRSNELTDTARIDFCLITAFVLTDFNVTAQQVVSLAAAVKLDSKRLQSAAQIVKHCKDDEICSIDNSLLTIADERLQKFYTDTFFSQQHMKQLQKHAAELFAICYDYAESDAIAQNVELIHEQALSMNAEFIKAQKAAAKKAAKKAK